MTNPFVDYLNAEQGSSYVHLGCPDKTDKDKPLPDALYRDEDRNRLLAIEHKALVWPPHFAERHRNDHLLMDRVFSLLDPEIAGGPFILELPYLLRASRAEIEELARQIGAAVTTNKSALLSGGEVSGAWAGREWRLRGQGSLDSGFSDEMAFTWNLLDSKAYTPQRIRVQQEVQRLCALAAKKFAQYRTARRILLLELTGDILTLLRADLLLGCMVPNDIDEIWTTFFETFDDGQEDWVYDLKWPLHQQESAENGS